MVTIERAMTAEQLLQTPGLGRCELLHGELVMMSPAGEEHGSITARVTIRLGAFVLERRLGRVFGAETGFVIGRNPDTVRAPDVAFVRAERLSPTPGKGFFQGPPDLAVEVVSPNDRASEVLAKVYDWLDAGCRAVWLVDPETRTVTVYRSRSEIRVLATADPLSGEDVVPGFGIPVAEVFGT
jgi:Uma2 family endonuclease